MSHKDGRVVLSAWVDPVLRDHAREAARLSGLEFSRWVARAVRQTMARESAESAPLICDATLATIVRIITLDNEALPDVSSGDCMRVLRAVTQDKHADALDWARRDGFSAGLIRALDEANEEAARTYDEQNEDERDFISRAADALNASFDAGVAAGLDGRTAAMGAIGELKMILHDRAGRRHETTIHPSGSVSTMVTDPPAPDPTRGKVTVTAKHSIPIEPYPARNGCTVPRCLKCGGCARPGACGAPCGPCPTCNTVPAPHVITSLQFTPVIGRAPEEDELAQMGVPHPNCSPDEPAAVKIWRARAAILQEERDAARAELIATKKKLQGVMYGGGKRRRK